MKTHFVGETKIASISRLSRIAAIAALLLLLGCASGAWAQPPVLVTNPINNPVQVTGLHFPVSYLFTAGQSTSTYGVPAGRRLVIEHININSYSGGPWFVQLESTNLGIQWTLTGFLLTPTTFPSGASYGVASSSARIFLGGGAAAPWHFLFTNGTVIDSQIVPAGVNVQVFGYLENNLPAQNDDF